MITPRQTIETEIVRMLACHPALSDSDLADTVAANVGADPAAVAEVIETLRQPKAA